MTRLLGAVVIFVMAFPAAAHAHTFAPAMLDLVADSEGSIAVTWTTSATGRKGEAAVEGIHPVLSGCRTGPKETRREEDRLVTRFLSRCPAEHLPATVRVIRLSETKLSVFVRATDPTGVEHIAVLSGGQDSWRFPTVGDAAPAKGELAAKYFNLGVEHIVTGFDHLAFLLCLLLMVRRFSGVVIAVTAFTIAHAVTISVTTVTSFTPPLAPIEALIAATIVLVALQVIQDRTDLRTLWAEVFVFGLLHGMGFAGALRETGVPEEGLWLALLTFNLGIEAGQLVFVVMAFAGLALVRRLSVRRQTLVHTGLAYAAGALGMFWFFDRTLDIVR